MTFSYDLTTEKWIPCIDRHNKLVLVSLREAIDEAHNLVALAAELPIMNSALFLFLLAFTSASHPLRDLDDWEKLYVSGSFSKQATETYLKKWANRFDLFDPEHPFYQDPKFGKREKDQKNLKSGTKPLPKSIKGLLMHLSSGSNATLFEHSFDEQEKWYDPAEIARILVMVQSYSLRGMTLASIGKDKYYKDSAFTIGVTFLCRGDNLFDSLTQNMIPAEKDIISQGKGDRPCWEAEDPFADDSGVSKGLLDLLTLLSRRILLLPELTSRGVMVKDCFIAPGLSRLESSTNPFYLKTFNSNKGKVPANPKPNPNPNPYRFTMNSVVWRDSNVILDRTRENSEPPITISLFYDLKAEGILQNKRIRLDLYGMVIKPNEKAVYTYVHERFDAPAVYLEDLMLFESFKHALALADAVRAGLYHATYTLASYKISPDQDVVKSESPDKKMVSALYDHISMEQFFWGSLEKDFYQLLDHLPGNEAALETWKSALEKTARASLSAAAEIAGDDAAGLKARAKAEIKLNSELRKALNPKTKVTK